MSFYINSYREIMFKKWSNPIMRKYDKVIQEFKQKMKVKENYKKVISEFKELKWIEVKSQTNYDENITNFFKETDDILQIQLKKYENLVQKTKRKITLNQDNRNKTLYQRLNNNCPICYDENVKSFGITRCGHLFCCNCLKRCVKKQLKCPICRSILFFKDIEFFGETNFNFLHTEKKKPNYVRNLTIMENNDMIFLPPEGNILLKNPFPNSVILNIRNLTSSNDIYNFEDFINYNQFRTITENIELNIKEAYNKKLSKMVNLFIALMRTRRGHVNSISEVVLPSTMDD